MVQSFKGSIKNKLIGIILFVTSLTASIGYGTFVYWYMSNQYKQSINLSQTLSHALSQNFAKVILLNDVSVAADITSELSSFKNINSMVLYKQDLKPIYQYSKDNESFIVKPLKSDYKLEEFKLSGHILRLYVDATYLQNHLGVVQLDIEVKTIYDVIEENIYMLILVFVLMILISYFLALYYAKQFIKPILKLVKFLEKVESLNFIKSRIKTDEDNEFGKLYYEVNTMLDRIESSYKEQKLASVAFETQSGMSITDANQKILRVNTTFCEITGYKPHEVIGKTPSILKSGLQGDEFYQDMMKILHKNRYWSGEIYNRAKNGTIYPQHLTIQSVVNDENEVIYYVASFVDLTLQKKTEAKLQYLKQYDILTGLANRALFLEELQKSLDIKKEDGWGSLISFGIKDFKTVNDAYGFNIGDLLLVNISQRLKDKFEDVTLIGRVSGDEFILWFDDLAKSKDEASIESQKLAQEILELMYISFKIDDKSIIISSYIGISIYEHKTSDNAFILLKKAESALHLTKEQDKQIGFFDKQAEEIALNHIDMHSELLLALENDEFELYYQLQYNDDGLVYASESLLRWNHPTRGLVSPFEFIPILEKTGLIIRVGKWIIKNVIKQLSTWSKDEKTKDIFVAINVSAKQFKNDDFVKYLEDEVKNYDVDFSKIKIELTESLFVDDFSIVIDKMERLRELGIQISLDDFGTGYASLEYLKRLPINQMKIDLSFVRNMLEDERDVAIVKTIITLGESLGLEVIAEGVETKEHFEKLKDLGCRYFQGYYFAKPKPVHELKF